MGDKLKTLKDLTYKPLVKQGDPILDVPSKQLRAEAIKLIKKEKTSTFYCTICEEFNCNCMSSSCFKIYHLDEVVKFVKHINDIPEGDLK